MFDLLKPFIARLAGSAAAWIAAYFAGHQLVTLTNDDQTTITSFLVLIALVVYSIVHKLVSKSTNPTDGATTAAASSAPATPAK